MKTSRMVAWYLLALAAIGAVATADELIRHGFLVVLGMAGPVAGYVAGRVHGGRRSRRPVASSGAGEVIRLRAEVEALRAERDQALEAARGAWEPGTSPAVTRAQILADPLGGARSLGGDQ